MLRKATVPVSKFLVSLVVCLASILTACGSELARPPLSIATPVTTDAAPNEEADAAPAAEASTPDAFVPAPGMCEPGTWNPVPCLYSCPGSREFRRGFQLCLIEGIYSACAERADGEHCPPAPALNIALAATPMHAETVKKALNVPSVGLEFTPNTNTTVRELTLTGAGNVSGVFTRVALASIVTSCTLFDGNTQLGVSQSPDTTIGTMRFVNLHWRLLAGATRTLTVRCTNDSVVAQIAGGDRYAIGIRSATDVVATSDGDIASVISLSTGVIANGSVNPINFVTVHDRGGLTVEMDYAAPVAPIFWLGSPSWYVVGEMTMNAQLEASDVSHLNLELRGDLTVVDAIAIANVDGDATVRGQNIFRAGQNTFTNIELSTPIRVVPGRTTRFQLWARAALRPVDFDETINHHVSFAITSGLTTGEWSTDFTSDRLNIRATGTISGDRIFARAPCDTCLTRVSPMILVR